MTDKKLPAIVLAVADTIGPLAAVHGAVVVIRCVDGSIWDIGAYQGSRLVCWGCGDELDDPVAGTSRLGAAMGEVQLLVRVCSTCLPPDARTVLA